MPVKKPTGPRQDATSEALDRLIGEPGTNQGRNGYAPATPEEAEPHTVRVRPSAWSAFESALRRADLKKGPAVDALVTLFAAGRIDVKLVRDEVKRARGVDLSTQDEAQP